MNMNYYVNWIVHPFALITYLTQTRSMNVPNLFVLRKIIDPDTVVMATTDVSDGRKIN